MRQGALLVLADGTVFEGEAMGALAHGAAGDVPKSIATGEIVFNTCLSGYQEVLTDPSYAGQVIAFTYPHIGNYGVSPEDEESGHPFCRGIVVRDITDRPSNWRSAESLERFLVRHGIAGITGIDTRRLTRHIREAGAMPCAFGTAPESVLLAAAKAEPGTDGVDLVAEVTTERAVCDAVLRRPASRRLRLRHQDDHPPQPRERGCRRRRARHHAGAGGPRPATRRRLPLERPRRPRRPRSPRGRSRQARGRGARLRDLPRPPAAGVRPRRRDIQAALRPPRRQPPREAARDRDGRDHEPEPWLRRRRRQCRRTPSSPTST